MNQTPQPSALSEAHDGVVRNPPEMDTVNCAQANHRNQISLSPSPISQSDCAVEMQSRSHDPNTNMPDFNGQPTLLPASHGERPKSSDLRDSISKPTDSGLSTQSPRQSRSLSAWPLKLRYLPWNTDAHPNTQSILSFALCYYFIIASLICLFAFLLYIFPSPLLDLSSFRK